MLTGAGDLSSAGQADEMIASHRFEMFFQEHQRAIFSYLWRMTSDEQTGYDLCQETFLRAWRNFEKVIAYERPQMWLFRVATNLALTERSHKRTVPGAAISLTRVPEPAISDPAIRIVEHAAVREALAALQPRYRAALILRAVHGFTSEELAQTLGMSLGAAKKTVSRARAQFAAQYAQRNGDA
jgi:RNA polymerase sigma-70 factor (ECF subfamily)